MSPRHKLQLDPRFSPRLVVLRALLVLTLTLPACWISTRSGHGLLALPALIVGLWPYRYRVSAGPDGLDVRWWCLRERLPKSAIAAARLGPDPRRWVIGRRDAVLRVTRRDRREFLVFGARSKLRELAAGLAAGTG